MAGFFYGKDSNQVIRPAYEGLQEFAYLQIMKPFA